MSVSRSISLRLFLEGQEIDVVSFDGQCGVNMPASADIEIPTADSVHRILPRTLVHVFYFDASVTTHLLPRHPDTVFVDPEGEDELKNWGGKRIGLQFGPMKEDFRYWRLLFVGEVVGYRYKSSASGRTIILKCFDCSSYWSNAMLYWGGAKLSSSTYKRAIFVGSTQVHRGRQKVNKSYKLMQIINRRPSSAPGIQGLLGATISLLESASGVYSTSTSTKFRGINDFMTQAEIRLKLTRMIAAAPGDDTSAVFLKQKSFRRYLRKLTKATKATSSYMDLAGMLLGKCYHNWSSVMAPPYFPEGIHKFKGTVREPPTKSDAPKGARGTARSMRSAALELSRIIGRWWLKCFKTYATGEATKPSAGDVVTYSLCAAHRVGCKAAVTAWMTAHRPKITSKGHVHRLVKKVKQNTKSAASEKRANTIAQGYMAFFDVLEGAAVRIVSKPAKDQTENDWRQIMKHARKAAGRLGRGLGVYGKSNYADVKLRQTLHCFMFMPDIYMCPPPKCNVLFPNQVTAIEYNREFFSEITRLALHGRRTNGKAKKTLYFAPNAHIGTDTDTLYKDALEAAKRGHSYLMKHEKYIGIIPAIMGLGDNDSFSTINKKTLAQIKKEVAGKSISEVNENIAADTQSSSTQHMARAANYMFFANRYDSRTMRVNCRFSPQIVPGMPCLVLDPNRSVKSTVGVHADIKEFNEVSAEITKTNNLIKIWEDASQSASSLFDDALSKVRGLEAKQTRLQNSIGKRLQGRGAKGTHYIGLVAGVHHAWDAQGGVATIVILTKCRAHTEGVGIFGEPEDGGPRGEAEHRKKFRPTYNYEKIKGTFWVQVVKRHGDWRPVRRIGNVLDSGKKAYKKRGKYRIRTKQRIYKDTYDATWKPKSKVVPTVVGGKRYVPVTSLHKMTVKAAAKPDEVTRTGFSFEMIATPPWFSYIYHPDLIGEKFYAHMVGCESILDGEILAMRTGEDMKSGWQREKAIGSRWTKKTLKSEDFDDFQKSKFYQKMMGKETEDLTDRDKSLKSSLTTDVFEIAGTTFAVPKSLTEQKTSVYEAAEALADLYLGMAEADLDLDRWVDFYTGRRFASMADIFGRPAENSTPVKIGGKTADFSKKHHVVFRMHGRMDKWTLRDPSGKLYGAIDDLSSTPPTKHKEFLQGFHTFAFGDVAEGTCLPGWEPLPDYTKNKMKLREPDAFVDPRQVRWQRVFAYSQEISKIGTEKESI